MYGRRYLIGNTIETQHTSFWQPFTRTYEKKRNNKIFRSTVRSVEQCNAFIYSDINDWAGLLSDGNKLKESMDDPQKEAYSLHIYFMDKDGRDK